MTWTPCGKTLQVSAMSWAQSPRHLRESRDLSSRHGLLNSKEDTATVCAESHIMSRRNLHLHGTSKSG